MMIAKARFGKISAHRPISKIVLSIARGRAILLNHPLASCHVLSIINEERLESILPIRYASVRVRARTNAYTYT